MLKVSENDGILGKIEYEEFKSRSINVKFFGQVFAAIGGAMFFGLLMTTANTILTAPAGGILAALSAISLPVSIGFVVAGAACVYMAQRYFYEGNILDQDFQAKKIAAATHSPALGAAHSPPEHGHTNNTNPPGMAAHEQHVEERPHTTKWAEKNPQRSHADKHADAHEKKPHEATVPKPHVDSWAEEVRHAEQQPETARTVH